MKLRKCIQIQIVSHHDEVTQTLKAFVAALNHGSRRAKETQIYEAFDLQSLLYGEVREKFGLRSQMAINCMRRIAAAYKSPWAQESQKPVAFKRQSMLLNYPRDYRIVDDGTISINTLGGRRHVAVEFGQNQRQYLMSHLWQTKSSNLVQRKRDKRLFLYMTIERSFPNADLIEDCSGVVGVDLGIKFLAVSTSTVNESRFYGGGRIRYTRWKYDMMRAALQRRGTRSAKRKLRMVSGREARFVADANHCISKTIVQRALESFGKPLIALETLTGIRRNRRGTPRGRRQLSSWSYRQLQTFIEYKARERNVPVIYIDPAYTSQTCPICGHQEPSNRDKTNHWFRCRACGYQSNDDRVASMNIRNRAVVSRHAREAGDAVNHPIVTDDEAETSDSDGVRKSSVASQRHSLVGS